MTVPVFVVDVLLAISEDATLRSEDIALRTEGRGDTTIVVTRTLVAVFPEEVTSLATEVLTEVLLAAPWPETVTVKTAVVVVVVGAMLRTSVVVSLTEDVTLETEDVFDEAEVVVVVQFRNGADTYPTEDETLEAVELT